MSMSSDLVSSTIAARAREPEGLRKMMIVSAIGHSIAIVALVVGPWVFGTHGPRETIMDMASSQTSGASEREHFIPVRKIDVLDALIKHDTLAGERELEQFRQFSRLLGAVYHYEYFDQLERLRNDYFYFNPELDNDSRFDAAKAESAYGDLIETLKTVLHNANFIEVPHEEIERSHRDHAVVRWRSVVARVRRSDRRGPERDQRAGSQCSKAIHHYFLSFEFDWG